MVENFGVFVSFEPLGLIRIGVHEAKELMACRHLYWLIDPRKEIIVLRASFIEVGKVDADSPLAFFFFTRTELESSRGKTSLE